MKKQYGQTLVELVVFIVVIGIVLSGGLLAFKQVLSASAKPGSIVVASQLADARMNLIILQRHSSGFTGITDPCSTGTLNACTGFNAFAIANKYVISSSLPVAVNGVRTATVTVSGVGNATNVMRFVQ